MNRRTKTAFGEYLVNQIRQAGLSQEAFYKAVGIGKPYFYDILTGTPPPSDVQYKMIEVLESKTTADLNRRNRLLNLAAKDRNEIPADIDGLLRSNSDDWDQIRKLLKDLHVAQRE